jgi:uncharacterized membrane protein
VTAPPPGGCYHDDGGALRLVVAQYDIAAYLRLAIEEIWHYGHGSPQIPGRLRRMLDDLHTAARPEHQPAVQAWRACLREPDPAV